MSSQPYCSDLASRPLSPKSVTLKFTLQALGLLCKALYALLLITVEYRQRIAPPHHHVQVLVAAQATMHGRRSQQRAKRSVSPQVRPIIYCRLVRLHNPDDAVSYK